MTMWADIRQLMFPPEFRISAITLPDDLVRALESAARQAVEPTTASQPLSVTNVEAPRDEPAQPSMAFLADVATGLWRIKARMVEPGTGHPKEEMRRPFRHLESTWDALEDAGLRIQDHTGELFDYGSSIKVIAIEPTAGLTREQVIDTLRPTIYFRDERIQTGEVIVGAPMSSGTGPVNAEDAR